MLEYDKDVIACPYPLKSLNWANLWERMKIQKFEDQDDMMKGGYTFPVKMDNPGKIVVENGICEVTHAPTGCMLIKRSVIEKMIDHYPELEINQPTFLNGNEVKRRTFIIYLNVYTIQRLNNILVKTLVSVKDGLKWVVKSLFT